MNQAYLTEVVLRMSDGVEYIVPAGHIISVDIDRDVIEVSPWGKWDRVPKYLPGATTLTLKVWVSPAEAAAARSPRDVTPKRRALPPLALGEEDL